MESLAIAWAEVLPQELIICDISTWWSDALRGLFLATKFAIIFQEKEEKAAKKEAAKKEKEEKDEARRKEEEQRKRESSSVVRFKTCFTSIIFQHAYSLLWNFLHASLSDLFRCYIHIF